MTYIFYLGWARQWWKYKNDNYKDECGIQNKYTHNLFFPFEPTILLVSLDFSSFFPWKTFVSQTKKYRLWLLNFQHFIHVSDEFYGNHHLPFFYSVYVRCSMLSSNVWKHMNWTNEKYQRRQTTQEQGFEKKWLVQKAWRIKRVTQR